jgi:oligopeptide transport system ATP-binding protein
MNAPALLRAEGLRVYFPVREGLFRKTHGFVKAVDGVDLFVDPGETLAVVGESGSGKSTLGRALLRLGPLTEGSLVWEGNTDLMALNPRALRTFRRHAQMIFQDPYASLNPRHSAGFMLAEPLRIHKLAQGDALRERVGQLLESVGLSRADASKYPHQFSGGQRQRLAIARALAVGPKLVVADEPVSALDMSVQAQILGLLEELRQRLHLTYVFISHDLGVVRRISNRVLVLYLGHVVEEARTEALFHHPLHPYTEALIQASRVGSGLMDGEPNKNEPVPTPLSGEIPSPRNPPPGCPFQTRCPKVMDVCKREYPPWVPRDEGRVACWLHV